eukprot:2273342-Prymnesium_polylepis.1
MCSGGGGMCSGRGGMCSCGGGGGIGSCGGGGGIGSCGGDGTNASPGGMGASDAGAQPSGFSTATGALTRSTALACSCVGGEDSSAAGAMVRSVAGCPG